MSIIDDVKSKLESSEKLERELNNSFNHVYSCSRVFSAWSYGTMSVDDFCPFEKGDEAFDEFFKNLKSDLLLVKIKDSDQLYDLIEKRLSDYELFYNDNLNDFYPEAFNQNFFCNLNFDNLYLSVKKFQESHLEMTNLPSIKIPKSKI